MKFYLVPQASRRPQKCVVLPQLGANQAKGYFDTRNIMPGIDPHAYVSVEAVEQMAGFLGFLSPDENKEIRHELELALIEIDKLEAERDEYANEIDAINVIRAKGWKPQRKPGRKPSKVQESE